MIDFSRVLAGPLVAQTLADLGADVIKVERPGHGDDTRTWGPPWVDGRAGDTATYHESLNRSKRSIVLDLFDPADLDVARALAATGDVVVDNFRPGFLAERGLDHPTLAAADPAVVTCTITAFGESGPASSLPGYDLVAQAMGGLMHLTGPADGDPHRVGVPVVDLSTGLYATIGVLAALADRAVSGRGRHVDVSLFDTALATLTNHGTAVLMGGADPVRNGNRHASIAPYEAYAASDGRLIIAAANDKLFRRVCEALDRPDLLDDPRFVDNPTRRAHIDELAAELERTLAGATRDDWVARLRAADVPTGPINSVPEAIAWAEAMALDPVVRDDGYAGIRSPIRLDGRPAGADRARRPPRLDEHGVAVRAELAGPSAPAVAPTLAGVSGRRRLALVSLLVDDHDRAIRFFVEGCGFELVADDDEGRKRWVVVRPAGAETGIVLAVPSTDEQRARLGDQLGGRVGFFVHTDDLDRDRVRLLAAGARFLEEPRREPYGVVAVWSDPWGNRWDLLQPDPPAG